jgi:hypothetical protein
MQQGVTNASNQPCHLSFCFFPDCLLPFVVRAAAISCF